MIYSLAPEAESDLIDIFDYSVEQWGQAQADTYLAGIYDTFAKVARHPGSGRLRVDLDLDIRSVVFGRHIIFYVEMPESIVIVRVLHQSRDIESAFTV